MFEWEQRLEPLASMSILTFLVSRRQQGCEIDKIVLSRSAEFSVPQVSFRHKRRGWIDVHAIIELNLRSSRLPVGYWIESRRFAASWSLAVLTSMVCPEQHVQISLQYKVSQKVKY